MVTESRIRHFASGTPNTQTTKLLKRHTNMYRNQQARPECTLGAHIKRTENSQTLRNPRAASESQVVLKSNDTNSNNEESLCPLTANINLIAFLIANKTRSQSVCSSPSSPQWTSARKGRKTQECIGEHRKHNRADEPTPYSLLPSFVGWHAMNVEVKVQKETTSSSQYGYLPNPDTKQSPNNCTNPNSEQTIL